MLGLPLMKPIATSCAMCRRCRSAASRAIPAFMAPVLRSPCAARSSARPHCPKALSGATGFFQESREMSGDLGRQGKLARMRMANGRHFFPGLGKDAGKLVRISLVDEIREVMLEEHDAHDVLEELR